ncbi:MAG: hypothetical protein HQ526_04245 [Actinobacteria bacterium]|nr:hypothetical protein [Actinomycetota bacterium]
MRETGTSATRPIIAPRLVTWALIIFGSFEVLWVVYLVFNQATEGQAFHIRLASVGLSSALAVLSGITSWMLWTSRPAGAVFAIAAATVALFSAMVVTLSPSLGTAQAVGLDLVPLGLAVVGTIGAVLAVRAVLGDQPTPRTAAVTVAAICLGLVALVAAVRTATAFTSSVTSELATHTRAMVVILDIGETIGLLGAGIASLRG